MAVAGPWLKMLGSSPEPTAPDLAIATIPYHLTVLHSPTLIGRTTSSPPVAKLGSAEHGEFITKPIPLGHVLYLRLFHYK